MSEPSKNAAKPEAKKIPRPIPRPNTYMDTQPFWAAAKSGKLMIQYCKDSGKPQFFPRPVSMVTGKRNLEWREVSGRVVDEGVFELCETVCGSVQRQVAELNAILEGVGR